MRITKSRRATGRGFVVDILQKGIMGCNQSMVVEMEGRAIDFALVLRDVGCDLWV